MKRKGRAIVAYFKKVYCYFARKIEETCGKTAVKISVVLVEIRKVVLSDTNQD